MKNIKSLKPKSFVFDHQLMKHTSAPVARIIKEHSESLLVGYGGGDWPVWKTLDWIESLEDHVNDYLIFILDDKVKEELKSLRKYIVHEADFDYIIIGD